MHTEQYPETAFYILKLIELDKLSKKAHNKSCKRIFKINFGSCMIFSYMQYSIDDNEKQMTPIHIQTKNAVVSFPQLIYKF